MSTTQSLKKCAMLLIAMAAILQMAGASHAQDRVKLLGVGDKEPPKSPTRAATKPALTPTRSLSSTTGGRVGSASTRALTKEYHHHRYLLEQSQKRLRKLEWEYRNGGGFMPAEVAVYREKVKRAYAAEKLNSQREMVIVGRLKGQIGTAEAAARAALVRSAPKPSAPRPYRPTSPRADDYQPNHNPTTEGYGGFIPRSSTSRPTTMRPSIPRPTMPSPILLPQPRPTPGVAPRPTPRPTPAAAARPTYRPRPEPIPVTLPPGSPGSIPLELVAPTYVKSHKK